MRCLLLLAACSAVCLAAPPARAVEPGSARPAAPARVSPDQAGRQGRQELDALMAKQRADKAALSPAAYTVPPPPSQGSNRREIKAMDNRIPTICSGC